MLQDYQQMPLAAEAQEVITIATPESLFTPTRVPQGGLNATVYFQGIMTELLGGLNWEVWVDEIVWWGTDEDDLLNPFDRVLGRLEDAGLFAATHKCLFSTPRSRGVKKCTRIGFYSSIPRSRGVERCTPGDRYLTTGNV